MTKTEVLTYRDAYEEPAIAVLGLLPGVEVAAYRFCRDLAHFATGVRAPYTVAAAVRRLNLWRAGQVAERFPGSPFVTITGPAGITTGQSR